MMNLKRHLMFAAMLCGALLALAPPASAHFLWFNAPAAPPQVGQPAEVSIGWGHCFPASEKCDVSRMGQARALGPDGKPVDLKQAKPLAWTLTPKQKGCYLVLAGYAPGFVSKTTEGYKMQDKQGLKEVLYCFRHDLRGKGLIFASGSAGYDQKAGDILELVPQADPSALMPGDVLPVLVLFKGKPLAGASVEATHAVFSTEPNKFAWQGKSDGQGLARVPVQAKGAQLIAVTHKLAFPDPKQCDQLMYKYTLTFTLR